MLLKNRVTAATGHPGETGWLGLYDPQSKTKKNSCQPNYQPPHGSVKFLTGPYLLYLLMNYKIAQRWHIRRVPKCFKEAAHAQGFTIRVFIFQNLNNLFLL